MTLTKLKITQNISTKLKLSYNDSKKILEFFLSKIINSHDKKIKINNDLLDNLEKNKIFYKIN